MRFVLRMLISAAAIFGVAYVSEGALLQVDSFWPSAVIAAVVLAIANATVKPIVKLFSLPITFLTLGLFSVVISAGMIYLVSWIVDGVDTVGFLQTAVAAIIIGVISAIGSKLVDKD